MDDARQVSTEEGKELAEHYNVRFLETSAKDCKNVEEAFFMMTREIKSRVAITQPKRAAQGKSNQFKALRIHGNKNQQRQRQHQKGSGEEELLLLIQRFL